MWVDNVALYNYYLMRDIHNISMAASYLQHQLNRHGKDHLVTDVA